MVDFRPIDPADLEALGEVFYEADDDLNVRRGLPKTPRNPMPLLRLFDHIVQGSPHRGWLAERDGRALGFGIAAQRADMTFLSFLFVRPDAQANGLGRALLERAMANSDYRAVCIGAIQPIGAPKPPHIDTFKPYQPPKSQSVYADGAFSPGGEAARQRKQSAAPVGGAFSPEGEAKRRRAQEKAYPHF